MKVLSCNYFGKNETIYFNVKRLAELELAIGKPLMQLMSNTQMSLSDMIQVYTIGMQHIDNGLRTSEFYEEKLQELIENETYSIGDIMQTAYKVLVASGILGKNMYYKLFPKEATQTVKKKLIDEELESKN